MILQNSFEHFFPFLFFRKKQSQKCEKITVSFEPHTHLPGQSARQTLKGIISSPGMVKKFVMPVFVSWDGIFKLLGSPGNWFLEIDSASLRSLADRNYNPIPALAPIDCSQIPALKSTGNTASKWKLQETLPAVKNYRNSDSNWKLGNPGSNRKLGNPASNRELGNPAGNWNLQELWQQSKTRKHC